MNHEILTNELDETTKSLIEKVEIMEKELDSKDEEIKKLKNELEFLKGIISNKNRKIFGSSSEQVDVNQLSLFNEAEKFSDSNAEEPTLEEITYKRAKKNNYIGKKDNLANLERVVIEHKLEKYQPYIFTDCELQTLFHSIDSIPSHFEAPNKEFIVPVLFRMMFCCGMRPSEPLHLKVEDVNLDNGKIFIRQSKRKKDRRIMLSEDLLQLCRRYDAMIGSREWFFQKSDGEAFPTYYYNQVYFKICKKYFRLLKFCQDAQGAWYWSNI